MKSVEERLDELDREASRVYVIERHEWGRFRERIAKQLTQQAAEWQIVSNERTEADRAMYHASVEALKQRHAEILEIERLRGEQALKEERQQYATSIAQLQEACRQHLADANKLSAALTKAEKEFDERLVGWKNQVANLRTEADARVEMERRNWEAYREGEKERIEAAVRDAYKKAAATAQRVSGVHPLAGSIELEIRRLIKASPVSDPDTRVVAHDPPPEAERPIGMNRCYEEVELTQEDAELMRPACSWFFAKVSKWGFQVEDINPWRVQ